MEILAMATLTKVEGTFLEDTMTILRAGNTRWPYAACAHNTPTVSGVGAPVPEQHPCMSTMLKHF
jgi:hypothetical protein